MPITETDLAHRLRHARESAGLTQDDVAGRLGLARSSVAQIELGNRSVSSLELDRLARLYGRSLGDFLAEEFDPAASLVAVFRAQAGTAGRDALLGTATHAIELARELAGLQELLDLERLRLSAPSYALPAPRGKWEAVRQGEQAAAEERRRLGLGDAPLGDAALLLESQGVRTALLPLPADVSGLALMDPHLSFFVVNNQSHPVLRRRFSWVHEYAHVLFDRDRRGTVSREAERGDLAEVRANAFAAALLMPAEGVRRVLDGLGKGRGSRERWELYDENQQGDVLPAEGRTEAGSQEIQLYDVLLLARRFGVSRTAALYRLKNLRLLSHADFERLFEQEQSGRAAAVERSLGLPPWRAPAPASAPSDTPEPPDGDFRTRFLSLALEAYRRDKISRGKLVELGRLVGREEGEIEELVEWLGWG